MVVISNKNGIIYKNIYIQAAEETMDSKVKESRWELIMEDRLARLEINDEYGRVVLVQWRRKRIGAGDGEVPAW